MVKRMIFSVTAISRSRATRNREIPRSSAIRTFESPSI